MERKTIIPANPANPEQIPANVVRKVTPQLSQQQKEKGLREELEELIRKLRDGAGLSPGEFLQGEGGAVEEVTAPDGVGNGGTGIQVMPSQGFRRLSPKELPPEEQSKVAKYVREGVVTVQQFRRLPPEEQSKVAKYVREGVVEIVPTNSDSQRGGDEGQEGRTLSPPSPGEQVTRREGRRAPTDGQEEKEPKGFLLGLLSILYPPLVLARLRAMWMRVVAQGNIREAKDVAKFLEEIKDNSFLLSQVRARLPEGVDFYELPQQEQLRLVIETMGEMISMHRQIEEVQWRGSKYDPMLRSVRGVLYMTDQFPPASQISEATGKLNEINKALEGLLEASIRSTGLHANHQTNEVVQRLSPFTSKVAGVIGGVTGGVVGGIGSAVAHGGNAMYFLAKENPLAGLSILLGMAILGIVNRNTEPSTIRTISYIAIASLGLPTIFGTVEGYVNKFKGRRRR